MYIEMNNNAMPKKKKRGLKTFLLCLSVVMFLTGMYIVARQYIYLPGILSFLGISHSYEPPPVIIDATPQTEPSNDPDATPAPYVKPAPVKMYFTARNISCEIQPVGRTSGGAMGTIDDPYIAGWYKDGPAPGEKGNSLINGHVRWGGVAGTFEILSKMEMGEEILIEFKNGEQKRFYVYDKQFHRFDDVPDTLMSQSGDDRVTLISCYGKWDSDAGTSSQRVFVICKAAS